MFKAKSEDLDIAFAIGKGKLRRIYRAIINARNLLANGNDAVKDVVPEVPSNHTGLTTDGPENVATLEHGIHVP